MKYNWNNILYIDPLGKTIPYQSPLLDTEAGTGFVKLKSNPEAIESIPETRGNPELLAALKTINEANTGVFSIGCQLEKIADKDKYGATGYIEFAINDQSLVQDATSYFSLFFQYQNRLASSGFPHAVDFDWAIMPAVFTEVGIQGFTCSIKINLSDYTTLAESEAAWSSALSLVASFLADVSLTNMNGTDNRRIY